MGFGKILLEFRAKHNLTQTQLAELLGVGIVMIHKYEHGINRPTAVNRIRFAKKMEEYEGIKTGTYKMESERRM